MTIQELIDNVTVNGKFQYGINTVMQSLRPNCLYHMESCGGNFVIRDWPQNQWSETTGWVEAPTNDEIKVELVRQRTVSEMLELQNKE